MGGIPYASLLFSEGKAFILFIFRKFFGSLILYPSGRNPTLQEKNAGQHILGERAYPRSELGALNTE